MAVSMMGEDVKLASSVGIALLFVLVTFCYVAYSLVCAFYNVYLHPLSKFPGPKLWIAFPVLRHITAARGLLDQRIRDFHAQYGEVVRYTSTEVSFITADAWKDMYSHGHVLEKVPFPQPPGKVEEKEIGNNIIAATNADHGRFRKALSNAFSAKALRDQEPLIKVYIDLLIEKLKDVAESKQKTDMMKWYNLTTFDLIGDLAFGASFEGLKNAKYHDWVGLIFQSIKFLPFLRISADYTTLMRLALPLLPKSDLMKARDDNTRYARETVMKRVHNENQHGRGDFMDSMLRHRGEKDGLTDAELVANGEILIAAGSEAGALGVTPAHIPQTIPLLSPALTFISPY